MNIVANSYFLRNLRNLPFFTLKLGRSKKLVGDDQSRFRKLSEFQVKYANLYENSLMEFGSIGNKVQFYEDVRLKNNIFLIFKNDDIYEIEWNDTDLKDLENFLLETLRKVDQSYEKINEVSENNYRKIQEYAEENEVWVAKDEKNAGKKYMINQTLSKEAYREALMNKIGKK